MIRTFFDMACTYDGTFEAARRETIEILVKRRCERFGDFNFFAFSV